MLLSIISSSAASSSAISMITSPGLPQYGSAVVVGFIVLLSLKEVFAETEYGSTPLKSSFNLAILPLSLCFFLIAMYKLASIMWFLVYEFSLFIFFPHWPSSLFSVFITLIVVNKIDSAKSWGWTVV